MYYGEMHLGHLLDNVYLTKSFKLMDLKIGCQRMTLARFIQVAQAFSAQSHKNNYVNGLKAFF